MQSLPIPERYEFKYVISDALAHAVAAAVAPYCELDEHSALAADRQYQIYSLYLDTPSFEFYKAKELRAKRRLKLRVRSYGAAVEGPVFLEVKRKVGEIVVKSRARLTRDNWLAHVLQPLAPDASRAERDFRSVRERSLAEPVLLVRYAREAYVSLVDSYARVTFDRAIAFQPRSDWNIDGDAIGWRSGDDTLATGSGSRVVLELKATANVPQWMMAVARRFDLQMTGFSKYCTGVTRLWGRPSTLHGDERVAVWA